MPTLPELQRIKKMLIIAVYVYIQYSYVESLIIIIAILAEIGNCIIIIIKIKLYGEHCF